MLNNSECDAKSKKKNERKKQNFEMNREQCGKKEKHKYTIYY